MPRLTRHPWLLFAIWPIILVGLAGEHAIGRFSVDLLGHIWVYWNGSQGALTYSHLIGHPEGVDLVPIVGGWLDAGFGATLTPWIGPYRAYNLTLAFYLFVAGLGGYALARVLNTSPQAALLAGLVLQFDGFVCTHMLAGRPEQVGLGFVALALAGAIHTWRRPGAPVVFGCGLAGAVVAVVSWEMAVFLALIMTTMAPIVWMRDPSRQGFKRWAAAALCTATLLVPYAVWFLSRTASVRATDEGEVSMEIAQHASIGLIDWLGWGEPRIAWLGLLALVLTPWTAPKPSRTWWLALGAASGLLFVLSLGPSPALWNDPTATAVGWSPFVWFQSIPMLGWFHWPNRLLAILSLTGSVAVAHLFDHLRTHKPFRNTASSIGVFVLIVALFAIDNIANGRWPAFTAPFASPTGLDELARLDQPGAVLDLPPHPNAAKHLAYQMFQMEHASPILFHMGHEHLVQTDNRAILQESEVFKWFYETDPPTDMVPVWSEDNWLELSSLGFRFVVLHQPGWDGPRWEQAYMALNNSLGDPMFRQGNDWVCWTIPQ